MRIALINNYSPYNIFTSNHLKHTDVKDIMTDCNNKDCFIRFGNNSAHDEIPKRYKFFCHAEVINPSGKQIQGHCMVYENPNTHTIKILVTDDEFYELGHISCYLYDAENKNFDCAWCVVENNTQPKPENSFGPIFANIARSPKDGHYKHVAKNAYDALIAYIKKYHPEIKELKANIVNEHSWGFHKKYGFTNKQDDEYDPYAHMNEVRYQIN